MTRPVLLIVHGNRDMLMGLEQPLQRRFGQDYQVLGQLTPTAALETLRRDTSEDDEPVAALLAAQWLPGMTGVQFLSRAHELHPTAKRVLLIPFGDVAAGVAGLHTMALGQLDQWLSTPVGPPELQLYPTLSDLLGQWARATARAGTQPELIRVVGPRWSARSMSCATCSAATTSPTGSTTPKAKTAAGCWPEPDWKRAGHRWCC
jgi:thioredoxin reductase (NADPH)